ncbi:hypothetical protein A6E15_13935 [Natrinema saccharevitans]|uniref:Uncharacterized protein n=1 Tax=Natrinema saccharevitans TaxID=301967 RepID=A0A1S8AZP3_9EURY|nr:hypothetical protein A6E15_13935 [Natrinema saccharevitans]
MLMALGEHVIYKHLHLTIFIRRFNDLRFIRILCSPSLFSLFSPLTVIFPCSLFHLYLFVCLLGQFCGNVCHFL